MTISTPGAQAPEEASAAAQIAGWLARHCGATPNTLSGVFVFGPPDTGPFVPLAFWPDEQAGAPRLADVAEQALAERRAVIGPSPPNAHALACPVEIDGHLYGVFALELAGRSEAEVLLAQRDMQAALAWVESWHQRQELALGMGTEQRLMAILDVLGAVLEEAEFKPACRALVTELAARLQCDRVSLGVVRAKHAEVVALSHSAQVGKRMNLISAVGAAMDEAIDQRAVIRYPPQQDDEIVVTRDHERLASEHGSGSVLSVPMAGAGKLTGALLFERPAHMPFQRAEVDLAQSVGAVLARILELKKLNERALLLRVVDACGEQLRRVFGPRYVKRKLLVISVLGAVAFFAVAQGAYRVTAPATLEGAVRRTLAAPFDGFVATAPARAGDVARSGDVLATLDDRDLRLERLKWASQYMQYLQQHREAVAKRDVAKSQVIEALYEQARAQVAMLDSQLKRITITAPFDGVIVSGDLSQSLGSAVRRGDALFVVTPLSSYRVIVEVDERDITDVRTGQTGNLVLSSITRESFPFTVGNVTSVTTAREGRNFFRIEAQLENSNNRLRPGMEGVAKIDVETRSLFWIWTHRLEDWLRVFIWTYWP